MTDPNAVPPTEPGNPAYAPQPATAAPLDAEQDKLWASLAHFGGVLGFLPSLIIWLVFKDRGQRTNVEAKEALNWQITFTIGYVVLWILVSIIGAALLFSPLWALAQVLWMLPFVWYIVNLVFSILGGVKVQQGGSYRYPFSFRFIK